MRRYVLVILSELGFSLLSLERCWVNMSVQQQRDVTNLECICSLYFLDLLHNNRSSWDTTVCKRSYLADNKSAGLSIRHIGFIYKPSALGASMGQACVKDAFKCNVNCFPGIKRVGFSIDYIYGLSSTSPLLHLIMPIKCNNI